MIKMESQYFFQFDCSSDNDSFFVGSFLYRGKKFRIGPWEPDGLRVDVIRQQPARCILTLIELEAEKSDVLKSARKYLPEEPEGILDAFRGYLERASYKSAERLLIPDSLRYSTWTKRFRTAISKSERQGP